MEAIASSEILEGIKEGITPDKPLPLFVFFKEQLDKIASDITTYREIMEERHKVSRAAYLTLSPPGGERRLAYELGERYIRLFSILHKYRSEVISKTDEERYRRVHV